MYAGKDQGLYCAYVGVAGAIQVKSSMLYSDESFRSSMQKLFQGEPSGQVSLMTLQDAFDRIVDLEKQVVKLEELVKQK